MTKKTKELKCKHRHTIKSHPQCFVKGLVKWENEKEYVKETREPWYTYPGYKIGFLDIESDGLKADFATMLTWCIKPMGGEPVWDVITKEELFEGKGDKRLIKSIIEEMSEYKIICGFYNTNFDLPFIRTKALHYNLEFPNYGDIYNFDLYFLARSKLCLSRKSLESVCDYLGIEGKTPIDREIWRRGKYGDREALKEILSHNLADCRITEALYNKLIPASKWTRRSI